jgi:aminobenzoyl-glutamate transport protein
MEIKAKKSTNRFFSKVERIGNSLPHPIYIFIILSIIIMIISAIFSGKVISVNNSGEPLVIKNLLNRTGIIWILKNSVKNFINFPPLGMVLVTMLGIGLAEETNFLKTLLKLCIIKAPMKLVTAIVIFSGIMGNVAGSAVFIIIPPLAAIIFKSLGKHPIAGLAAGFIGVSGGLSANLLITPTDVINAGITDLSAKIIDPNYSVNPSANWYFMIVSTFLLTLVGTIILDKFIEPRLGKFEDYHADDNIMNITTSEKKALKIAGGVTLIYIFLLLITIVPTNGILRGENGSLVPSPFLDSMIPILTLLFFIPAFTYGKITKQIKNKNDLIKLLSKSLGGLSSFVLLCFFAAQFVSFFSYTNLGIWISITGANYLKSINLFGLPVIIMFILFCTFTNFFIGSLSAKWTILAPIFVPMFMEMGLSPAFTQAAFRIADSVTNPISPLEPFIPFIIITMQKYNRNYGLGTIISIMFPLSIGFLISWTTLLIIWYLFNFSLGPQAGIFL